MVRQIAAMIQKRQLKIKGGAGNINWKRFKMIMVDESRG
jgi:hypothetical protein